MSENIDIRIREDGSRVVARNLNDAATGAEKADKSITGLNKTLANSSGAESATAKLKAMIRMAEMYGSGLVKSLDQTTNGYRNSLMKHFEMVSKEARASAASIKSQMEALTAAPVNMNELNAYYRKQEALAAEQTAYAVEQLRIQEAEEVKSSAARLKVATAAITTRMREEAAYSAWWIKETAKRDAALAASAMKSAEQRSKMQAFNASKATASLVAPDAGTSKMAKFYAAQSKMDLGAKSTTQMANYQAMQRQMAMYQLLAPMAQKQLELDNQAEAAAKRVTVAKAGLLSAFGKLVPAARSAGESQQFWNGKARDAHALARGLSGSLGQLWLTYGSIAPLLAGAALGSAFVNAAKSGSELSYSLQFVKSLGGESQIAIDKLRESTIALAKESQYGPAQIADGYRILAQAGLDATQSLAVMPDVLALATTGEMTMEQAGLALVGVMNAFNLKVSDSKHITDVFAKAAAVSQTSVSQMTEAMKTASTVGEQYNQSMEGTATALALLAKVNITGTAAGTSFRNMLKEMFTPTKAIREEWERLGIEMEETVTDKFGNSTKKVRDFADVVYDLKKKMDTLDEPSKMRLSSFLSNERGSKELVAMLNLSREEWDKFYSDISEKSEGFAKKVAEDLNKTAKGEWKIALNTLEATLTKTFAAMEPQFISLAEKFRGIFESPEFVTAVTNVVTLMLQVTTTIVDLIPVLVDCAKAWVVLKAGMLTMAMVQGAVQAFGAVSAAVGGLRLAMATFSAVAAGTATTLTGGSGLVAALGLLGGPITIILGLLAAGATAWLLWGNSSKEAMDKASRAAASASANIQNMLEQQQAGFKMNSASWSLAATKAIKARADVEAQIQDQLKNANETTNIGYRYGNGMVFDRNNIEVTNQLKQGKGWTKDVAALLTQYDTLTKDINVANSNMSDAVNAEKQAKKVLEDAAKPKTPTGTNTWTPPTTPTKVPKVADSSADGKLNKDENALAKLQASLKASKEEYATIEKTGEAQFKLNEGQQKALELKQKIIELESKSTSELGAKGMAGRADQLKNLNDQLNVATELGVQLQKNELLKVNKKMDEEIRIAQLLPLEREKENKFIQYRNELLAKSVLMDESTEASLKRRIADSIELNKVLAARDSFVSGSNTQKVTDFQTKAEGLKQASKTQVWTQGDTDKNAMEALSGMGVDTTNFQETQNAALAQQQVYYDQLQAMRDKDLISEETYQNAKAQLEIKSQEIRLASSTQFFTTLASLQTSSNSTLARIGKAAAIAQATMDGVVAVQKAYAGSPYPWNIAAAAAQAAISAANVAQISGLNFATGGSFVVGGSGGVDSQNVAFRASPGERVSVQTPTQVRKGTEQANNTSSNSSRVQMITVNLPPGSTEETRRAAGQGAREGLAVLNAAARYK